MYKRQGHTTTDNLIKYDGTCRFESTGGAGVYAASGASYCGSDHDVGLVLSLIHIYTLNKEKGNDYGQYKRCAEF